MLENIFRLDGKVIVITGAAGFLGRMHADAVASFGGIPILLDLKQEKVEDNLFVKNIIVNKDKRKKQILPYIATERWIDQLGNRLQINS